ncbi:uncharacterized protein A1O9_01423 [Exophiala aquamarina CBS 119918]|uniref:AMP-dependent synthetase/ligase domain-containing protein n=1 Tax=Exophiala aquamarina CBS 119918 TaxID=1182545 RepID=A0A072Q695_9EURO|nr:uncharacterized protein A1O9_01423 [Exophiala aquamarina CBS 119918]KEF63445.1 hypothetical protein A1O9_01423 [Exophiala aquamarina CBS 119918]
MLSRKQTGTAVIDMVEGNLFDPEKYSWNELRGLVKRYANALRASDAVKGDIVALVGGNCVRSLALLLATTAIGVVFSSFATDIGEKALDDRLGVLRPRFVFAESGYSYNGKTIDISRKISSAYANLRQQGKCELVVIGPTESVQGTPTSFDDFINRGEGAELVYEQLPFESPAVVMFSSGTTGVPKGIVHSHGGLLMVGLKEYVLHNNLGPEDVHFHFSGIGWTLWNISIGALFTGSTLVLYDGSPFYPSPERFLEGVFAQGLTSFGAGPRYYSELQKRNIKPYDLKILPPKLHTILSTGALLTPALATWLVSAFGAENNICQLSMSGGTELCGSFLHGTRSLPSYPGELAVKSLGMDVAVYSAEGTELPDGESGELVCRKPFPNMPAMFLNDEKRERYYNSYFSNFPHVWTHGDFIQVNPETRGIYVLGRSDGVLNPSGIRFGSSEIYNITSMPQFTSSILDAIVVGQQRVKPPMYSDPTESVVLFIRCTPSASSGTLTPNPKLVKQLNDAIAKDLTRRHVPAYIFEAPEIPYNANGKKLEIQLKAVLCGGREALEKLKTTKEEKALLVWYVKFFEVEKIVKEQEGRRGAKL